jgi:putative phosphoribosyl transferase
MISFPDGLETNSLPTRNDSTKRFPDLRSAGCELALRLERFRGDDVVVMGIVLGGVLPAHEVALRLGLPFDLVIIRRLLAPDGPGSQICAVNVGGTLVVDAELPPRPITPVTPLDYFVVDALSGLARRERICRGEQRAISLRGKTIILVDCGIRTGSTMQAAIGALQTQQAKKVIAAAPVASFSGRAAVAGLADELIFLCSPRPFGHVGLWYADFNRPADDRVGELLMNKGRS